MQRLCRRFVNPIQGYNLVHIYQRLVLYSTSTATSPSTGSFANYLFNSLGLSPQQAISASKRLSLQRKVNNFSFDANAVSIVGCFKSYGFDDTRLRRIVSMHPRWLCSNVEDTLRPKLRHLQNQGFSESDIIEVVYENPGLLLSGVESRIVPAVQVLRKVMGSDTHVIAILKKSWFTSETKYLMPNVALLTSYGIPIELIRKRILSSPRAFMRKPEMFNDIVNKVKNKWGICPSSPIFLYGIQLAFQFSKENIEAKCRVFKSFGWTQSDIQTLMMKTPTCFTLSKETIEKKLNFLMNELRLEPGYLISNYVLFNYSLEKRIVPRHKMLLFLKEKGLLERNPSLSTAFSVSESRFLKMFVIPFKGVHELYAELTGCTTKTLTQKISETRSLK